MIRSRSLPFVLSLLACLALPSDAAKVVRLYNAWPSQSIDFRIIGAWNGISWQGPETAAGDLTQVGPWYEKILPATYNPLSGQNKAAFSTTDWKYKYGANGFGDQSDIDIASILKTSDTVWIVPTPLPNGKPLLYGTRPRQITVMFLNPWPGNPSLQVAGGPWMGMRASNRHAGWSEGFVLGFNTLDVVFRSADSTRSYGMLGTQLGATAPTIDLDAAATGDTVWVRPRPDPDGIPFVSTTKPKPRTIMLFNPWVASKPVERPLISFEGGAARKMNGMATQCGWFGADLYERTPKVSFSSTRGGLLGGSGFGSTEAIDLSAIFATQDTAWIVAAASGPPSIRTHYTGETGLCEFALLAATVYDFDSSHPDFEQGSAGVLRGMILPRLGPDRKPIKNPSRPYVVTNTKVTPQVKDTIDDFLQTEWFRPTPGRNTQTCRDIPLTLDSTAGSYLYDDPMYFPVDDFKTLPDGTPNPSHNLMSASDLTRHNFSFCLESHGEFDYRKGQVFRFRGDDDVWFFINNLLVVDLGGVHAAEKDSVRLDDIGYTIKKTELGGKITWDTTRTPGVDLLVEGQTYPFDFFFCERQTGGSSIMIQTDMNMRTRNGFQVKDSATGTGTVFYDLYVSQTSGQGCQAQNLVVRTSGRFYLTGPGRPRQFLESGRTHFGGIRVDAANNRATIDSAAMIGLPAGDYVLQAVSDLDTTKVVEIPFRIPYTTGPRFLAMHAFTGPTGSGFALEVGAFNAHGPDSSSISFLIQPVEGLAFYRDSTYTSPIPAGDTLRTGTNTVPRRLWVRGLKPGSYTLSVGKSLGDYADLWSDVVFLAARPVFKTRSPYTGTVGSVVALDVTALNDLGTDSSETVFGLRPVPGLEFYADSLLTRRLSDADTLHTGIDGLPRRVWARGTIAGTCTVVVGASALDSTDARGPIVFQDKGLRFTTSTGTPLQPTALERALGDTVRLWFETFSGDAVCSTCGTRASLRASAPGILFLGPDGAALDTIALVSGRGSVLVRGTLPADLASLLIQIVGDSASRAVWSPVSFTVAGPDSANVEDLDGDGHADRLVVHLAHPWSTSNQVVAAWPDSSAFLALGVPTVSPDSLTASFPVTGSPLATQGDPTANGTWRWSASTATKPFPIQERIAPVPLRAVVSHGTAGAPDTLRVRLSESVFGASPSGPLERLQAPAWTPTLPDSVASDRTTLTLFFRNPGQVPSAGDSVRLGAALADARGNHPGPVRRAIVVEGASPPPLRGWLLDLDGDGAIDHARVLYPAPVDPSASGRFAFRIDPGAMERPGRSASVVPGSPALVQMALESPFPAGTTSFPAGAFGTLWREGLPGLDGLQSRQDLFPLADSAPPGIRSASLRLTEAYDQPDTLVIVATEPVSASGSSFLLTHDHLVETSPSFRDARWLSPETLMVLQWPDDANGLRAGDSVRWTWDGTLVDAHGNAPASNSRRRVVTGGLRRPLLRITPPRPLTLVTEETGASTPLFPGIQILGGDPASLRRIDPANGTVSAAGLCPEARCLGPSFELNQPVRVTLLVYDRLGVWVAGTDVAITPAILEALGTDRLGRTQIRLRWDVSDMRGAPVASGVYLMRLLVTREGEHGNEFLVNHVWKVGVNRPGAR